MNDLLSVVDRFDQLRVLVVGDALLDRYLDGHAGRLCREAPVPVVTVHGRGDVPGGAANAARNLRALGAQVTLLAAVGDDDDGARLRRVLGDGGVAVDHVLVLGGRRTLTLTRVVASSQLLVRFDHGDTHPVGPEADAELARRLGRLATEHDAVLVSDYGYGTVGQAVIDELARLQARSPRVLVVDSKRVAAFRHLEATAVKPNWPEAVQLLADDGLDGATARAEALLHRGDDILALTGARIVAVTLDREGAVLFERGRKPHRTYAQPTGAGSCVGAGDTFVAALTLAVAAGADTPSAGEVASLAAAIVVGKRDTAVSSQRELRRRAQHDEKVAGLDAVAEQVAAHRADGRRIVLTNGCFDILHRGHVTYLNRAKALGDVLVVGVNDDEGVRRLKGPSRPINALEDRLRVLAALSCIDHLVPFGGASAVDVVERLRPDVYVKGGDHTPEALPEAPVVVRLGGRVEIVPYEPDLSTTGIIDRVRSAHR